MYTSFLSTLRLTMMNLPNRRDNRSGGMVVVDQNSCMVDIARFSSLLPRKSRGKCTFCRIGTKRMLEILNRITDGVAREQDFELLRFLAEKVKATPLCGLGQTAPNPVLTTIRHFRDEYEAHVRIKVSCRCLQGFGDL